MKKFRVVFVLAMALCISTSAFAATFTPGTYEGVGEGRNGNVKVAVTLDDKGITKIEVLEHEETDGFGDKAFEGLKAVIIENQTLKADAISGATLSSNGYLVAVAEALKVAGTDVEELGYVAPALPEPWEQIKETGANKEGYRNFEYTTQGNTCSSKITFVVKEDDMSVNDLVVYDGCDGNSRGFSALAEAESMDVVIERFAGILCHASDGSSCPDQVSKALNEARFLLIGERLAVPAN
ncbi:MAG: TSCPD domain-containing protein [Eubacteriales bacterium]|nr:TSCPD domain-containing protein [Eubacteriales bacterium]